MATDPTTLPTIGDIQQAKKDMTDINTFVASEQDAFTDNTGKSRKTLTGIENAGDSVISAFETESQAAILEMQKSRGFRVVGTFADGFTYELFNDVGIDTDGNSWIYVGTGAPNKVVAAGTFPSVGAGYEQVTFNSASGVLDSRGTTVQDYIDGNLTPFKNIADMKAAAFLSTLPELTRIEWQGYYAQSDGGSNWGVLRFGSHTEDGGSIFSIDSNTYIEANLKGKSVSVLKFGAMGESDSDSIEAAALYCSNVGVPITLSVNHEFDRTVNLTGDIIIKSFAGLSNITSSYTGDLFTFSGGSLELSGVKTVGMSVVKITGNFNSIKISKSDFTGVADSVLENVISKVSSRVDFEKIELSKNKTRYMSILSADDLYGGNIYISKNEMTDSTRFICRSITFINPDDGLKGIEFTKNKVLGINTSLTTNHAARVVQGSVVDGGLTLIENNEVRNLITDTAANLVYIYRGDLICSYNRCFSAGGKEAWIHDKGEGAVIGYRKVDNNVFDQSGVLSRLDAIIKIYTGKDWVVKDNEFININCTALHVYESFDVVGNKPERNGIINNKINGIDNPYVFLMLQASSDTLIADNRVYGHKNQSGITLNGIQDPTFLYIYISRDGDVIKNPAVLNNQYINPVPYNVNTEFMVVYIHPSVAPTARIEGLIIKDNISTHSSGFVRFTGKAVDDAVISHNVIGAGVAESTGTTPTSLRVGFNIN